MLIHQLLVEHTSSSYAIECDCGTQGQGAYGKVYKALRGGVQDVAVKQLSHSGDGQLEKFIEVGYPVWV